MGIIVVIQISGTKQDRMAKIIVPVKAVREKSPRLILSCSHDEEILPSKRQTTIPEGHDGNEVPSDDVVLSAEPDTHTPSTNTKEQTAVHQ